MASQEDTDDLYADLYGADVAGEGDGEGDDQAHAADEQDLIGYEEDDQNNGGSAAKAADDKQVATAASTTSFIPAASSTPTQQGDAGMQIKGSFIPPPAAASSAAHSHSDVRDLTPASHNDVSSIQQSASQHGAGDGGEGQNGGSDDRPVMPHEMPEEGKMFVGGLNWDTTEDSLRRYFSQFGEVGNCTIMRDNMTGRSRGFAFLNFVDPKAVNTVMVREHYLDGKVIDPKRAIPRPQRDQSGGYAQNNYNNNYNNNNNYSGGGGGNYSAANQKLFVGGLPPTVTPGTFRTFFEQFGPLSECTCMMDRETGNPRGFGFLTYADDSSLQAVLNTRPIVFEGKEVDVKRAQSKNDPQSLQIRRQQRNDDPSIAYGMQQFGGGGGRYNNNNNFNAAGGAGNNAWQMNPMMMGMGGDMSQMYQNWGGGNGWNPQMAWQQMMATMAAQNGGAGGGMDMSAMMGGMMGGGMGMMGGMGSMSPPSNMSPSVSSAVPTGPATDGQGDRAGRFQRGGSQGSAVGRAPPTGPRSDRERSPGGGGHRRERSPDRRDQNRRYEGQRNR
ncbi:hypothetical protein PHBOTO_002349 [Pseudozyma hubeiensis]|nr:hypothetical protein PHBOTO_002349 [Pseudozyma hubeiensis]